MTGTSTKVLVIDDDRLIRRLLRSVLPQRGFIVSEAETGGAALKLLQSDPPDVIILDLGLPDFNGLALLRHIRTETSIPIVVLSYTNATGTKVEALDGGASDYVTKPFHVDELAARLHVAVRHRLQRQGAAPVFRNGELSIDLVRRRIKRGATDIRLSPTEFAIVRLLVMSAGKVLTHDQVLRDIWNRRRNIDYLRVYMRQVRKRLEVDPGNPQYILTVPGVGYQLQTAD
ncbi:MAG TPA: response regulator transcription factor [Stellaceae bacterium]|nr:response regulator transcription factor [Stellaceae bacterium]